MQTHSLSSYLNTELSTISEPVKRFIVAFSGGLDSSVLLDLLVSLSSATSNQQTPILAWHINHGLQDNAAEMEQFCRLQAENYGVDFRADTIDLDSTSSNLEKKCRDQRYQLFEQVLSDNDLLFMAHHADDQTETFLLNALRGAGVNGLQGIPKIRSLGSGILFRPLLDVGRDELKSYAEASKLEWIDDPSNKSLNFDRNYLRHNVIPDIKSRWPSVNTSLSKCTAWQQEAQLLLSELADQDYQLSKVASIWCDQILDVKHLRSLSEYRQKNLIRYWLSESVNRSLSVKKLEELIDQIHGSKSGQAIIDSGDFVLKFYDQKLFLIFKANRSDKLYSDEESIQRQAVLDYCGVKEKGQNLELKTRKEVQDSSLSHRLKRLFQKEKVPPWERDNIILIFVDDELINILCPDFLDYQRAVNETIK